MCRNDNEIKGNIPPEKTAKNRLCPTKSVDSTPINSINGETSSTQEINDLLSISIKK